jgi:hypothetical protein
MYKIVMNGYTRITKAHARKVWTDLSVNLALVPVRQIPGHPMGSTIHPSPDARVNDPEVMTFDRYVNSFVYYNCNDPRDEGKYPAFYIYN